jgi:hypothetical protein
MVSTSLTKRGRGRPKGAKNKATLEKAAVMEAFNQRVLNATDSLFNAQLKLATGSQIVFRVDPTINDKGKVVKEEHVHVTDPDEIKALLDEYEGGNGTVDGHYYYFQAVMPNNQAIDSLLNRTFGKPKEFHESEVKVTLENDSPDHKCEKFLADILACRTEDGRSPTLEQGYQALMWAEIDVSKEVREQFIEVHRRKWLGDGIV